MSSHSAWANTTLGEVADWGSGGTPSRKNAAYFCGDIPWIKTGELGNKFIRDAEEKITEEAIAKSSAKVFPKGSVGIAMYGATIGKVSIFGIDASTNQACAVANPLETALDREFLYYFLLSEKRALIKEGKGGAQPNISQGLLKDWPIQLPPIKEQHRIVAKIEELFSELDKGIENLKTAREQLKVYRQALLKHAFEGKLTEQWRKANADKMETADQLLERIKQEREARYQQQLEEWKAAVKQWEADGKEGKKPAKPKLIKKIDLLNQSELPELPSGWLWFSVSQLCDVVRGGSPRPAGDPKFYDGEIPFLKVADITRNPGAYLDSFTHTIKKAGLRKTRFVKPPILMLSNSGATLGVPKICQIPTTFNDGIAAFLGLTESELLYHYYFWESKTMELRNINQGAAQPNLNTNLIQEYLIPVCSKPEMDAISTSIEESLSINSKLEEDLEQNLKRAEALRQSILKKAFSGQLVPQDPDDEPASVLLDRIAKEKEEAAAKAKKAKAAKKKPKTTRASTRKAS